MDSIYTSPEDFNRMKHRDRIRGIHLPEYFVNRCHEIGVIVLCGLHALASLSTFVLFMCLVKLVSKVLFCHRNNLQCFSSQTKY